MACYHPLKAFQTVPGAKLKFAKKGSALEELWNFHNENFNQQIFDRYGRTLKVACGQCLGCRMTYARNWAIRCLLESCLYPKESCWFVTLTYSDVFVPRSFACDVDTGEVLYETQTLVKRDFQLFMKRFRKNLHENYGVDNIRFFACGEYGSLSKRPHYHFILFGLPFSDKYFKKHRIQNSGHLMYDCKPICESWSREVVFEDSVTREKKKESVSIGISCVEELTFDSAAYVAGYMLKKVKGKESDLYYKSHGIIPEFSLMSRKPGIAGGYYDMYGDEIYKNDSLQRRFPGLDYTPKPPKYFDNLFKEHHPHELELIKTQRKNDAIADMAFKLKETGLTEEQYLAKEEERIKSSSYVGSKKC